MDRSIDRSTNEANTFLNLLQNEENPQEAIQNKINELEEQNIQDCLEFDAQVEEVILGIESVDQQLGELEAQVTKYFNNLQETRKGIQKIEKRSQILELERGNKKKLFNELYKIIKKIDFDVEVEQFFQNPSLFDKDQRQILLDNLEKLNNMITFNDEECLHMAAVITTMNKAAKIRDTLSQKVLIQFHQKLSEFYQEQPMDIPAIPRQLKMMNFIQEYKFLINYFYKLNAQNSKIIQQFINSCADAINRAMSVGIHSYENK